MQLFWRKGYAATSIEDLVDALHLSRSSLYDTFGDKRKLFLDALNLYTNRVLERLAGVLKNSPSPMAGIRVLFDDLSASAGSESGAMGCFVVNSVAELVPYDPDVTAITTTYATTFQKLLTEALSQDQVTRTQTSEQLAAYLFNTVQGLRILIKSGAKREQIQAIIAIVLNSLQ
jgi:TetR/AcrR family transcriptional repressor of nem operon